MKGRVLLEVCVDTADGLRAAVAGGADRIELCAALDLGGLTPSTGLLRLAADCGIAVRAMIRPRAGSFVFDSDEMRAMEEEITQVRALGLDGVVIGAALGDARLDTDALARLAEAAGGMGITLHRVVDLMPDPEEAVAIALSLGIDTILTSGGAASAAAGAETIAAMVAAAGDRITVMPGSGVRAEMVSDLLARTGARAVHASCSRTVPTEDERAVAFGFAAANRRFTDREAVTQLRSALDRWAEERP